MAILIIDARNKTLGYLWLLKVTYAKIIFFIQKLMVQKGQNNYRTMKQTLSIKRFACQNWQIEVDNAARIEKICSPSIVASQE